MLMDTDYVTRRFLNIRLFPVYVLKTDNSSPSKTHKISQIDSSMLVRSVPNVRCCCPALPRYKMRLASSHPVSLKSLIRELMGPLRTGHFSTIAATNDKAEQTVDDHR